MIKKILLCALLSLLPLSILAESDNSHDVRNKPLKGTVTLSFDDGPNPTFTPQILDILKKYNADMILQRRLERFVSSGELSLDGKEYRCQNRFNVFSCIDVASRILKKIYH